MKYSILFLLTVGSLFTLQGQEVIRQTIRGTVLDEQGKYPLLGAAVELILADNFDLQTGTITDADGSFVLTDVPMGRHSLRVSYLGYEPAIVPNLLVASGKALQVDIELREQVTNLPEMVVQVSKTDNGAINSMATGSVRTLSMEALQRFSGGFGDPARMAQNYAGVSGATDDRNDIIVRGNSPTGVLWRLEGVDIPSPNHWGTLGTTGGPVSMLNANNLRNSDFFSGAFPAEYGNATAAVFDLQLRNGNTEEKEFLGQIGFNGFELGAEGPLKLGKNASFVTNLRYSTLGVFNMLGINFGTGAAIPVYKDGVFKFNLPTENSGTFSLWGLGGISDITFYDSGDNIYTEGSGKVNSGAKTGVLGLSHLYFINPTTSSKVSIAVTKSSSLNTSAELDTSLEPAAFVSNYQSDYQQTKYVATWTINKKISASDRLKTGVTLEAFDLGLQDISRTTTNVWATETNFEGNTGLSRGFIQWQHRFSDQVSLNTGLHAAYLGLNASKALEPRVGLSYQIHARHRLALGFGRHSQLQPLPVYFTTTADPAVALANRSLDFIRSNHYTLTYSVDLHEDLNLKVEAYHQTLSGLAVDPFASTFSLINAGASFGFPDRPGLVNEGLGKNTGIELTLEKVLANNYYLLLTTSVFDSKYRASDGLWRNTYFNSNFVGNFLLGREFVFSDKWSLSLDSRISYAGGRRYTPIDLAASRSAQAEVRDYSQAYEAQFTPYFRTDFKVAVRNNERRYSQVWAIDLVNLTGRQNEFNTSYNATSGGIRTTYQRGFFPNILYQIHF